MIREISQKPSLGMTYGPVPRLEHEQLLLDLGECARDAVNASVEAVHRANDLVRLYARHSGLSEEQAHHVLFAPGGVKEKRE